MHGWLAFLSLLLIFCSDRFGLVLADARLPIIKKYRWFIYWIFHLRYFFKSLLYAFSNAPLESINFVGDEVVLYMLALRLVLLYSEYYRVWCYFSAVDTKKRLLYINVRATNLIE